MPVTTPNKLVKKRISSRCPRTLPREGNQRKLMKIKYLFLVVFFVASVSIAFAQPKVTDPKVTVTNLYKDQKAGTGPFFQTKNRSAVDKYFVKDIADLIWKDAVDS